MYLFAKPWLFVVACLVMLAGCQSAPRQADSLGVTQWLAQETVDIRRQLLELPRFQGRKIAVLIAKDGRRQAVTNRLIAQLKRRLTQDLLQQPGIHVVNGASAVASDNPCADFTEPALLITLDEQLEDGQYRLKIAAIDRESGSEWVGGFSHSYSGPLTALEQRQHQQSLIEPWAKGLKSHPFETQ